MIHSFQKQFVSLDGLRDLIWSMYHDTVENDQI
jgi:hypothetical protein